MINIKKWLKFHIKNYISKNGFQNKYKYSQLKKRGANKNSLKVRKGKVVSYRDELSKSDIDFVDKQYKSVIK